MCLSDSHSVHLTVDIGNTRTKLTVFDNDRIVCKTDTDNDLSGPLNDLYRKYRPEACAVSAVRHTDDRTEETLQQLSCRILRVTGKTPSPLRMGYRSPETLGADRLAAVVGAITLCPGTDLLVIDAGTCITYDFVDASGFYAGGNIAPGLHMRLEALHEQTARLPLVEKAGEIPELGKDTETAIRSGVIQGIRFETEGYIRLLASRYPNLRVFLTGGDICRPDTETAFRLLTEPDLVAYGLNRLLKTNSGHTSH